MVSIASDIFDPPQQAAFDKITTEHGGIVWMRVGDGKTRVALMSAADIAQDGSYPVIFVICRREAFYDWKQEIATLQLPYDVREIESLKIVDPERRTIVLVSHGMLTNVNVQDAIQSIIDLGIVGAFVVDELWLFKNPQAKKHLALRKYTQQFPTIGLSGSVMTARDLVDIFGQVAAVGRMKQLAKNLTHFREEFQTGIGGNFWSWYPKPGAYKAIMEKIAPFTYIHMPTERKTRTNILKVDATDYQKELFKELKQTAAIEELFELKNVANIVTKAQQISNGWLETPEEFLYFDSPKVDRCLALVEEILSEPNAKVVIWCAFRQDLERLIGEMRKYFVPNFKIATLQSGTKFDMTKWQRSDCRVCIATEASGTSINHFAQVPYGIYFSQDFKWTSLQQSQGRHTRRSSQHEVTTFTFLHTEKSLDAQVYYTVKAATNSEASFIKQMDVLQWVKGASQGKRR